MRKTKIALFGSYSGYNKGDLSILVAMLKHLLQKQKVFQVLIPSKKPFALKKMLPEYAKSEISIYKTLTPCWGLHTIKYIRASDVLVFGGGGLFFDRKLYDVFFNHIINLFFITLVNNLLFKKPVYIYAVGASHLGTKVALSMTKYILRSANHITARDYYTAEIFSKLQNSIVDVYYDPGFLLDGKDKAGPYIDSYTKSIDNEHKILFVFNKFFLSRIKDSPKMDELVSVINYLQKYYRVVLSHNTTECKLIDHLFKKCNQDRLSLFHPRGVTPEELITFFKIFDFAVCVPMHAAIFSYNAGIRMITVEYDDKVKAFNRIIGNKNSVGIEELNEIPRIIECYQKIDWNKKKEIRKNALNNIIKLKEFVNDLRNKQ